MLSSTREIEFLLRLEETWLNIVLGYRGNGGMSRTDRIVGKGNSTHRTTMVRVSMDCLRRYIYQY